jgi:hypothetical protein
MAQNAATPDEILHLSWPSRQGDETKISLGVSQLQKGVNLIETLQYYTTIQTLVIMLDFCTTKLF